MSRFLHLLKGVLNPFSVAKKAMPAFFVAEKVVVFVGRFVPFCTKKCTKTPLAKRVVGYMIAKRVVDYCRRVAKRDCE